jgi:hypothetical protein
VRRSDDYGASWNSLFYANGFSAHDTSFLEMCEIRNRLFLVINDTGGGKLLYSDNFGTNWTKINLGQQAYKIAAVDTVLILGCDSGIYVSPSMGTYFINTYSGTNLFNTFVNGNTLFNYGGVQPFNLSYSTNYGFNWTDISTGLPSVNCMAMDNNYLYAGTYANSLWKQSLSNLGLTYTPDTGNNYTVGLNTVQPHSNNYMRIFPNPYSSNGRVLVHNAEDATIRLQVLDMDGRCLQQNEPSYYKAGDHIIGLRQDLAAGIYFVVVNIDGNLLSSKVVKQ